ncbi:MAG: MltA domain-containing protein [Deltaproteobacteria bacterium]|nr:MltA domain-containing protein [Deltaproteobacteria bacterium]
MKYRQIFCFIVLLFIITGCAVKIEKPIEKPVPPLVLIPPEKAPSLVDDLDRASLKTATERSLQYYEKTTGKGTYGLGNGRVTGQELKDSLLLFREILDSTDSDEVKQKKIRNTFDIYKATGLDNQGRVFFTGYFESILEGSRERTEKYRYPIYKSPDDIVVVSLGKFNEKYKNEKIIGRLKKGELVPYFTRADIEEAGLLGGRNLELFWVNDPIDLFFMHIQGSGKIRLPDENIMQVSYAQKNGHPYRSIGRYLLDKEKLTSSEMTHQSIKKYLREHPEELSDILNYNKSYVFFRIVEHGPIGALGLTLTSGRSIATDLDLFPKGALAFVRLRKPIFDKNGNIKTWEIFSRFVLNQDTGGVIKGPGRVDLFCGTGSDAEMLAGSLKENGELYFLVKKKVNQTINP